MQSSGLAVYIHIPFCPSKCGYCDFNSYAMSGEIVERTAQATKKEILGSPWRGTPATTIFFGGGTPTFIPTDLLLMILEAVFEVHPPLQGCEITSEANPGTVDASRFREMRSAGFNRISLGAQSFADTDLHRLGRVHSAGEIERAAAAAKQAGFENLNLDLMFALPGQTPRAWAVNLRRALALEPTHLSLYCLTLEPNTPFYKQHLQGRIDLPEDDLQVEMYELAVATAQRAGYEQYEISNFAKPGFQCRHNLAYWTGAEYAGYGPGAVGCMDGRRYTNLKHPVRFCEAIEKGLGPAFESEALTAEDIRLEKVMLGLRLNDGLSMSSAAISADKVSRLESRGWISRSGDRISLTGEGRHFCSEAVLELVR